MRSIFVNWGESLVKLTWQKGILPQREFITSVHGFCFFNNQLLLVNLNDRGWDLPGGHIETGETPEECIKREAMEEGYVEGDCQLLGAIEVDHHDNPMWDEASKYPIVGYQLFYRMDIKNVHPFEAEYESNRRIFIQPSDIAEYKNWHGVYQEMLDNALQLEARR